MNRRELFAAPLALLGLGSGAAPADFTARLDTSDFVEEITKLRLALERAQLSESLARRLDTPRGTLSQTIHFGDIRIETKRAFGSPDFAQALKRALEEECLPSA